MYITLSFPPLAKIQTGILTKTLARAGATIEQVEEEKPKLVINIVFDEKQQLQ